jgi:hypothetical protein
MVASTTSTSENLGTGTVHEEMPSYTVTTRSLDTPVGTAAAQAGTLVDAIKGGVDFLDSNTESGEAERLYPHLFDESGVEGRARNFIIKAISDAELALDSFGDADLADVSSRLSLTSPHDLYQSI